MGTLIQCPHFLCCDKESYCSFGPTSLYVEVYVVHDHSGLICHIIDVPYFLWFVEGSFPQLHLSYEGFAHEAIGCSRVYKCFYVGHCVASSDRDRDVHGSKSRSHYYRIELMNCPHPGQWVQAF